MDSFKDVGVSFAVNGRAYGQMAQALHESNFDLDAFRPFRHTDGRTYVSVRNHHTGRKETRLVANNSTMMYEDWRTWDTMLIEAYKERLGFVQTLLDLNLTKSVNAMTTMVISHQRQTDITTAEYSFDGLSKTDKDRPEYDTVNIPLPFFHKNFGFNMRELSIARANGTPLDTRTSKLAVRRVAELVEAVALGNVSAIQYGSYGSVYGLRNHPSRSIKSMTLPTASGWTPQTTYEEVLDMKNTARLNLCYGPYLLLISSNWEPYLDKDYSAAYPGVTLRQKLNAMGNITKVVQLDKLANYQMILLQPTTETVRMIVGMQPKLIQWQSPDGGEANFQWITCMVPEFFTDIVGNCGIVHATAA